MNDSSSPSTRRKSADAFDDGLAEVLDSIFAGEPLERVLEQVARRIEARSDTGALCSIYLSNADGTELRMAAAPGLPADFNRAARAIPIAAGVGSCGSAAALGRNILIDDITRHPDWAAARGTVLRHGLKSCWSVPVFSADRRILGTMGIYHRSHRMPGPDELELVESTARLAGLAIERARAAAKLREGETLLRIAGQNARLGGWTVDFPDGRVTWSDEVRAIHEVPPGFTPGSENGMEFYLPESRPVIQRVFERCRSEGAPFDEELRIRTAKGRELWIRAIGEAVRGADGNVIRIQGAFQDISRQKRANEEILRLGTRLSSTLKSISDALYTLDREWRFAYLNPVAEKLLRRTSGKLLGKTVWETFPEIVGTEIERAFRRAAERGETLSIDEYFHEPFDQWFEIRIYPIDSGLAVYFRDITAKRRASAQLRLLEACVARINDIVIITDADSILDSGSRILFVNDAFTTATGYRREEVIGRSVHLLHGPRTQRPELDRIQLAKTRGEAARAELVLYRKDGSHFWLEIDIVPLTGPAGEVTHFVSVLRDITVRKQAEARFMEEESRYIRQRNSLISLSGIPFAESGDTAAVFRRITEAHARALKVGRVSIWLYNSDRSAIRCEALFDLSEGLHSSGSILAAKDYPSYFLALEEMDVIAVDDARGDPRTREFTTTYLEPNGITSMIDAPVLFNGVIQGVLCSEQVGAPRRWTGDEKTFVAAVANVVSLELEAAERRRAEQAVREIQKRFEIVARVTNDAVWDWNIARDEIWWNEGFETLFGLQASETGHSPESRNRRIHPDDVRRVVSGILAATSGDAGHWSDEYRFQRADGSYAHVLDRGFVIRDGGGKALRMVGGMTDLTARRLAEQELARLNRALKMLSACNEAQFRETTETGLLTEICRIAVDTGGYRMAWVGYARDDAAKSIEPVASAGTGTGYLAEIQLSWDENHVAGRGPGGATIRGGKATVCEDIAGESAFFHWLDVARRHGYASVTCLPLKHGNRTIGLLGLYGSEVIQVSGEEVKLLQELADNLSFGIGSIRAKLEHQRTQEVVLKVAQAVSSGTGSEFFDLLVGNMVATLGGHGGLIGKLGADGLSVNTVSFVLEGRVMEKVTYSLKGTPCEDVSAGRICVFEDNVQRLFPDDHLLVTYGIQAYAGIPLHDRRGVAGIMVVLFPEPIPDVELVRSTLQIFAARAAAELDRQVADAHIREQASLLDKARDAILVRALDHRITYWNKSAERLYGWTEEEAIGRSSRELLYADTSGFQKAYDTVLECGEWLGELTQVNRQGEEIIVESRWNLLRDPRDRPHSILSINTDITRHQELKRQFLRAQRLESIGTLAGGIAHDLNNVLAPISMSIELLRSEVSGERGRELLDTLAGSANRGAEMIGQVLSFARGMEGRRVEIHPRHVIDEVARILKDTFPKDIVIAVRIPDHLPLLQADPTQLHQVLLNLCVNARDALEDGGRIAIDAKEVMIDARQAAMEPGSNPGPYLRVRIEDDGRGIPPRDLDRIFEPFFTTKETGKGTGLGLSTSLAIVRSHGGFIRAGSAPGHGSRFEVFLPCQAGPGITGTPPEPPELPRGHGETILIADDEEPVRRVTGRTLESFGFRVILAAGGREAVELFQRHHDTIAVVITDMMMPDMDGSATIRELVRIDPGVRIIASSGVSPHDRLAPAAGTHPVRFIVKPYDAGSLLKLLREVIPNDGTCASPPAVSS